MIKGFNEENLFLSNNYPQQLKYKDIVYNCAMNAFYAQLVSDELQKKVIATATPMRAHSMVENSTSKLELTESEQEDIMYDILKVKFADEKLKHLLLETSDKQLVNEVNWEDLHWGIYQDKGENKLGELLMNLRDEFKSSDVEEDIEEDVLDDEDLEEEEQMDEESNNDVKTEPKKKKKKKK